MSDHGGVLFLWFQHWHKSQGPVTSCMGGKRQGVRGQLCRWRTQQTLYNSEADSSSSRVSSFPVGWSPDHSNSWSSSLPLGVSNCGETLCLWNWQCPKVAGSWSQEEVVVFPLAQFCGVTWELFLKSQLRCISLAFPSDSLSQLIICIKCFSF